MDEIVKWIEEMFLIFTLKIFQIKPTLDLILYVCLLKVMQTTVKA